MELIETIANLHEAFFRKGKCAGKKRAIRIGLFQFALSGSIVIECGKVILFFSASAAHLPIKRRKEKGPGAMPDPLSGKLIHE
jgi:hypothetical protein